MYTDNRQHGILIKKDFPLIYTIDVDQLDGVTKRIYGYFGGRAFRLIKQLSVTHELFDDMQF